MVGALLVFLQSHPKKGNLTKHAHLFGAHVLFFSCRPCYFRFRLSFVPRHPVRQIKDSKGELVEDEAQRDLALDKALETGRDNAY